MTRFLFRFLFLSFAIVLEAILQSLGLLFPLTAFVVLYFAYVYRSLYSFVIAFMAGLVLGCVFGYHAPFECFLMMLVVPVAVCLYVLTDRATVLPQVLTGALLPIVVCLPPIVIRSGWGAGLNLLPQLFLAFLASALGLPLVIRCLDVCSHFLNLPEFNAQKDAER